MRPFLHWLDRKRAHLVRIVAKSVKPDGSERKGLGMFGDEHFRAGSPMISNDFDSCTLLQRPHWLERSSLLGQALQEDLLPAPLKAEADAQR